MWFIISNKPVVGFSPPVIDGSYDCVAVNLPAIDLVVSVKGVILRLNIYSNLP